MKTNGQYKLSILFQLFSKTIVVLKYLDNGLNGWVIQKEIIKKSERKSDEEEAYNESFKIINECEHF